MRKAMYVLFAAVLAFTSLLGTASASNGTTEIQRTAPGMTVEAPPVQQDVSAQALSCPSSYLCAWRTSDGSEGRCRWMNRDPNWQAEPGVCSWSGNQPVRAARNSGTNTSYTMVCLYEGTNYTGPWAYYLYRGQELTNWPNALIRSHRWVTGNTCFP